MVNSLEELFHSGMGVDQEDEDDDPDLKDEALLKINLHVSINHIFNYIIIIMLYESHNNSFVTMVISKFMNIIPLSFLLVSLGTVFCGIMSSFLFPVSITSPLRI